MPKPFPTNADGKKPPTPGERSRAAKLRLLRKAGKELIEEDALWLETYEQGQEAHAEAIGASRASRVTYEEETREAVGTGDAAAVEAVSVAALAREEGRRYDSLLTVGIEALRTAVDTYQKMAVQILERNGQLERAQIEMMATVRRSILASVHAEADAEAERLAREAAEAGAGGSDGLTKLAEQLLPLILSQLGATLPPAK